MRRHGEVIKEASSGSTGTARCLLGSPGVEVRRAVVELDQIARAPRSCLERAALALVWLWLWLRP